MTDIESPEQSSDQLSQQEPAPEEVVVPEQAVVPEQTPEQKSTRSTKNEFASSRGWQRAISDVWKKGELHPQATCDGCHCIALGEPCPTTVPVTDYSLETIAQLAYQMPLNPYSLSCNPYYANYSYPNQTLVPCDTDPPLEYTDLGDEAACGLHYETSNGTCPTKYRMKSYPSRSAAEAAGAFVTHAGACGVCSTTQDLAGYIRSPDLTTEGKYCAKQNLLDFDMGVNCYLKLGFTRDCANIWAYNSMYTSKMCIQRCLTTQNDPNNGDPPECKLNDCLQCDEDVSGPLFKKFGARTRRRSGLLSAIARPCSAIVLITQDACPDTIPLDA